MPENIDQISATFATVNECESDNDLLTNVAEQVILEDRKLLKGKPKLALVAVFMQYELIHFVRRSANHDLGFCYNHHMIRKTF